MCNCPTGGLNLDTGKKTFQNIEIHVSMTKTFFFLECWLELIFVSFLDGLVCFYKSSHWNS